MTRCACFHQEHRRRTGRLAKESCLESQTSPEEKDGTWHIVSFTGYLWEEYKITTATIAKPMIATLISSHYKDPMKA